MAFDDEKKQSIENAFLVGVQQDDMTLGDALEHLAELSELVATLKINEAARCMTLLKERQPRFLFGSGKAHEIIEQAKSKGADCIVFDCELSPSQQRNWEKASGLPVTDRQEIILDIFAKRAWTREAVLQIEVARLQYALPRLTRAWTHLSRQRGGNTGARGEGEKQIELDKRMITIRLQQLRKELEEVRSQRQTQRKGRERTGIAHASIVGYTNAGKSSLINTLTGAAVYVEDQLFATLDPTTRKYTFDNGESLLLTDTVGFVRRLPHLLVEAFKSTLEEAVLSDFLILVLDASSARIEEHWQTTLSVLESLGAKDKPMIVCFNKMDLQQDPLVAARLRATHPDGLFISVKTGLGMAELEAALRRQIHGGQFLLQLRVPPHESAVIAQAHRYGAVQSIAYDDDGAARISLFCPPAHVSRFDAYKMINLSLNEKKEDETRPR